jgi:nitroreductase/NAD-dependent dihydropyrimidine dehydrogenase PreA subunit
MIDRTVSTTIDPAACTGCGLCVLVCPSDTITMQGGKAVVTGTESIACGHCEAVCPADAVHVGALDPQTHRFSTVRPSEKWLPHGAFDTENLVALMQSRRSCRNFRKSPVDRNALEDLVKIGITAPSATNSQRWTFTLLPEREHVLSLGEKISDFFRSINRKAENRLLRILLKSIGKPQLANYYRDNYASIQRGLEEREKTGRDRLFHGAPSAIVVGSKPDASCPCEDAMLATGNILLTAHAMGLGSCLIGFAVAAINNGPGIKNHIGIPEEETVYAVIALGYPKETYTRPAGRRKPTLRTFG